MKNMIRINILIIIIVTLSTSCIKDSIESDNSAKKEFKSSFESINDFSGFYITPQGHLGTTFHELTDSMAHSGSFSHKAWIDGVNPPSTLNTNNNHRGYPTIQLQNTTQGTFNTPCYIKLWVWLNMEIHASTSGEEDDWFSFATFTDDESDNWERTVLVNLNSDGLVHLQHTTGQGQQTNIFQSTSFTFPQKEWVELNIYLDFRENGYAKVWQNGQLVSHAEIGNISNKLSQAHFGLYCSPQLISGTVYNDDLVITEVDEE